MSDCILQFFITGTSLATNAAIAVLRKVCHDLGDKNCELRVVDILGHPQQAAEKGLLLTPALVIERQGLEQRFVGDLTDPQEILEFVHSDPGSPDREEESSQEGPDISQILEA